jgi:hypothetical protein
MTVKAVRCAIADLALALALPSPCLTRPDVGGLPRRTVGWRRQPMGRAILGRLTLTRAEHAAVMPTEQVSSTDRGC